MIMFCRFPNQLPRMSKSRTGKIEICHRFLGGKGEDWIGSREGYYEAQGVWPSDPGVDLFPEDMQQPIPYGQRKGATDRRVVCVIPRDSTLLGLLRGSLSAMRRSKFGSTSLFRPACLDGCVPWR